MSTIGTSRSHGPSRMCDLDLARFPGFPVRHRASTGPWHRAARPPHVTGIRRARYLGLPRTRLEHIAAATAINLLRLDALWTSNAWLDNVVSRVRWRLPVVPALLACP